MTALNSTSVMPATLDWRTPFLYLSFVVDHGPVRLVALGRPGAPSIVADMSRGEMTLAIMGRLYLTGHLDRLNAAQFELVIEAVALHKDLRHEFARSVPFWPLGVPGWDDPILALGFRGEDGTSYVAVWSRSDARSIRLPGVTRLTQIFPAHSAWATAIEGDVAIVDVPTGSDAAVFRYV